MNTIYDGTYTIGQTSATNFQAGPGIVITQPSEGTVRIANDETVLYSGTLQNTSIQLSESPYNFEYVEFEMNNNDGANVYPNNVVKQKLVSNWLSISYRTISPSTPTFPNGDWYWAGTFNSANNTISVTRHQFHWHMLSANDGGLNENASLYPVKITGINRISGSNA